MRRRRVLFVLAGLTAGALDSPLVRAADPAQRVVRVGFVGPGSLSTAPRGTTVAVIANPDNPVELEVVKDLKLAAATRSLKLRIIGVRDAGALGPGLNQAGRQSQALLVFGDALLLAHQKQITAFAAKHRLPGMYALRDFADAGELMAYAPDLAAQFRRAAEYVDTILKGAKPGDLPIEQPTQFQLVVNLKTAKALGLIIPQSILVRADEVIK